MSYLGDLAALTSDQSIATILQAASDLLSDSDRWCTDAHAINSCGQKVRPNDPTAVAFSIEGAISKVSNPYGLAPSAVLQLLDRAVCIFLQLEPPSIYNSHDAGWFNDTFDHEDVLLLLKLAQEMLDDS